MKLCFSKVAGPSVSSPDPTPVSEISLRWEAIAAGEKHELCRGSLSMAKRSSTSKWFSGTRVCVWGGRFLFVGRGFDSILVEVFRCPDLGNLPDPMI